MKSFVIFYVIAGLSCLIAGIVGYISPSDASFAKRYAHVNAEPLIDRLTAIDCPLPGVSETGTFGGFLAETSSVEPSSTLLLEHKDGTLHVPVSCRPAAVQNIMWLGPAMLTALIRHLGDKRQTKLVVGQDLSRDPLSLGGQFFADEYDSRHLTWTPYRCEDDPVCNGKGREIKKPYIVKVGDICFALIGQIVNRHLSAVRYQPTAIMLVNSPIESPTLAARIRKDWGGTDSEGLKKSLLADLHLSKIEGASDAESETHMLAFVHAGALRRLRYFYPDAYAALTGPDLEMRNAFESKEHAGQAD